MDSHRRYASREDQAKAEIGHTAISRRAAACATLLFLTTILSIPLIDQINTRFQTWRTLRGTDKLTQRLHAFETTLEEDSPTARHLRPLIQYALTTLHTGTDTVYPGREGWLFYDPDLRHVTGRGFLDPALDPNEAARNRRHAPPRHRDPLPAILDFRDQLRARGIDLILVPTPVKPTVHPEMLHPAVAAPADNPSFARFKERLADQKILVYDPTPDLLAAAKSSGQQQYLATDTHWRPEAVDVAAANLARFVTTHIDLPQSLGVVYRRQAQTIAGRGDLAALLHPAQTAATEPVTVHPVLQPTGQLWQPTTDAEILFLGDSFSNIYSAAPMGWGQSAGLAEQLSHHLQRPLDAIRQNDQGARATRQALADDLSRGHDRLAGKKLVIWQFATRELSVGDWRLIPLPTSPAPQAATYIVPPTGESWLVTGRVAAAAPVPRPGSVAYRDHIRAVHLTDITIESPTPAPITAPDLQAVVYLRSMTNNQLTPAATLQPGQQVRLQLQDWSDVSRQYDFIHRTDLETGLGSQSPCWGQMR